MPDTLYGFPVVLSHVVPANHIGFMNGQYVVGVAAMERLRRAVADAEQYAPYALSHGLPHGYSGSIFPPVCPSVFRWSGDMLLGCRHRAGHDGFHRSEQNGMALSWDDDNAWNATPGPQREGAHSGHALVPLPSAAVPRPRRGIALNGDL